MDFPSVVSFSLRGSNFPCIPCLYGGFCFQGDFAQHCLMTWRLSGPSVHFFKFEFLILSSIIKKFEKT